MQQLYPILFALLLQNLKHRENLENEMKLKGRQIDALWLFFKNDKIYKNYMKCRLCREQLYFGGLNNKQVIRSLKVHVRIKHPQKWNEFQRKWRTKTDS